MHRTKPAKSPKELTVLEEIARVATLEALLGFEPVPEKWRQSIVLGTLFDGDDRVFELYIPGERPADAIVISSARVNRKTKQVAVTITNLARKTHS